MITKPGMEQIHKASQLLIDAKYEIIRAGIYAESLDDHIKLEAVSRIIQAGIKEILKTFFPKEEFDEKAWLKRRTSKDAEHEARVQTILDEAVATGACDAKEWLANVTVGGNPGSSELERNANLGKLGECDHVCKDCDQRHVVGNEEYCLQGEEMN
jgi:hypothetical protein